MTAKNRWILAVLMLLGVVCPSGPVHAEESRVAAGARDSAQAPLLLDDGWQVSTPEELGLERGPLEAMTEALRRDDYPNVHAVLIAKDGKLVYEEYFQGTDRRWQEDGRRRDVPTTFDRDMLHEVRSVTKSMTSAVFGLAVAEETGDRLEVFEDEHGLRLGLPDSGAVHAIPQGGHISAAGRIEEGFVRKVFWPDARMHFVLDDEGEVVRCEWRDLDTGRVSSSVGKRVGDAVRPKPRAESNRLSVEQWRENIRFVEDSLLEEHPDVDARIDEATLRSTFGDLSEEVLYLDDHIVLVRLMQAVARVEDGHTSLSGGVSFLSGARCVLLDIRDNGGGNGYFNPPLVQWAARSPAAANGKFFVAIGRATFSAAQKLATSLELKTDVVFVGEPTGSRANHFGDAESFELPHADLTLRVSSLFWEDAGPGDQRELMEPDIPVPHLSSDYFQNHDLVLDEVISRCGQDQVVGSR